MESAPYSNYSFAVVVSHRLEKKGPAAAERPEEFAFTAQDEEDGPGVVLEEA